MPMYEARAFWTMVFVMAVLLAALVIVGVG